MTKVSTASPSARTHSPTPSSSISGRRGLSDIPDSHSSRKISNLGKQIGKLIFGGFGFILSGAWKLVSFCLHLGNKNGNFVGRVLTYARMEQYDQAFKLICKEFLKKSANAEKNLTILAQDVRDYSELYSHGITPQLALSKLVGSVIFDDATREYIQLVESLSADRSSQIDRNAPGAAKLQATCGEFHAFLEEVRGSGREINKEGHFSLGLTEIAESFLEEINLQCLKVDKYYEEKIDLCLEQLPIAKHVLERSGQFPKVLDLINLFLEVLQKAKLPFYRNRFIKIHNVFLPTFRGSATELLF